VPRLRGLEELVATYGEEPVAVMNDDFEGTVLVLPNFPVIP
jgi:hypothetical protein